MHYCTMCNKGKNAVDASPGVVWTTGGVESSGENAASYPVKQAPIPVEASVARATYIPESLGTEIEAPSGYYTPVEERFIDLDGKRLLYVLGSACIETSCCGTGSWSYARVEGYVVEQHSSRWSPR